ncbi:hypothetical protein LAZ67_14002412 [Cordylochernes scorpioides]|uniref:Uncharacterized protein n=1 Tax=Cordylochernes scorpioides TaxID=51811 RepID=A0ABY6LB22_9ARAC|nr:hypothetical protein LAZ67_14002412 [Cordylochernes scorpioides]
MLWILISSPVLKDFLEGNLIFTYVVFVLGFLLFLSGFLGWLGTHKRGGSLLKLFISAALLAILVEVSGIVALNVFKIKMATVVEVAWAELNPSSRHFIQKQVSVGSTQQDSVPQHGLCWQLECCGFMGPQDFIHSLEPLDDSCYILESSTRQLSRVGCKERLVDWLYKKKHLWMTCIGALLFLQVIVFYYSCC